jgi:hypothetical protein
MADSRRAEAQRIAEELLSDMELQRVQPIDIARRASRLARLLDDSEAYEWLAFEVGGYPTPEIGGLDAAATRAAERSRRVSSRGEDGPRYWTASLGWLQSGIDGDRTALAGVVGGVQGEWAYAVEQDRKKQRAELRQSIADTQALLDRILGAIHDFIAERHFELRFGSAVESAFEIVRQEVDSSIAALIPGAPAKLAAAFEDIASPNPEHWAHAASTCRRLLKAAADALRPPGPEKAGRRMDDAAYINRLVDWINENSESETAAKLITADLEYLGHRLDAVQEASSKGAHAEVSRFDASRFLVGTYVLLGDILRAADGAQPAPSPPVN